MSPRKNDYKKYITFLKMTTECNQNSYRCLYQTTNMSFLVNIMTANSENKT